MLSCAGLEPGLRLGTFEDQLHSEPAVAPAPSHADPLSPSASPSELLCSCSPLSHSCLSLNINPEGALSLPSQGRHLEDHLRGGCPGRGTPSTTLGAWWDRLPATPALSAYPLHPLVVMGLLMAVRLIYLIGEAQLKAGGRRG